MEIVSPPAFVLEAWTDIVIGFPFAGAVQSFTLRPGDGMQETGELLMLTFNVRPGLQHLETLTFYLSHVAWISKIVRMVAVDPDTGQQVAVPKDA